MGKYEFLGSLEKKLRVIPANERRDAMEYYEGYITDAESEAAAIEQLGSPGEVAAIILANYVSREPEAMDECTEVITNECTSGAEGEPPKKETGGWDGAKIALVIIFAIFAVPIAFSLAVAVAAVAFALFVTLVALVFSFAVTGIALLVMGVASVIFFPFIVFQSVSLALFVMGTGIFGFGLGILFVKLAAVMMSLFPLISQFVSNKILRRVRHEKAVEA
jgi:uncharacterized membrane protein